MRGSRNFCQGGPGPTARNSSDNGFCLFFVLNFYSFTVAFQWFISKKTIILEGFGGWGWGGCPTYTGGGGGLGVQTLILETHRTFDFPGGGADPISPSGSAHVTI